MTFTKGITKHDWIRQTFYLYKKEAGNTNDLNIGRAVKLLKEGRTPSQAATILLLPESRLTIDKLLARMKLPDHQ